MIGLVLLVYPSASNYYNSFHQSQSIARYAEQVSLLTADDYKRLWNEAQAFNQYRLKEGFSLDLPDSDQETYQSLLNIGGDGIMGYIEIPKISVSLPIYHGTSDAVLQVAVGHLDGTSLPVGGRSTHCVLSGHRGLPSAVLFTDLDKMVEGDLFTLQILNQTLTYEVDQIRIVDPFEVDYLNIADGEDYCTLVTCTPYGINSHRMLVRGVRTENRQGVVHVTTEGLRIDPILVVPFAAAPMLLVLLLWVAFAPAKRKKE